MDESNYRQKLDNRFDRYNCFRRYTFVEENGMGGDWETRTINFEFKSSTIPSFMASTKSDYVPFELFFSIHVGMIYHHLYTPLDPSYS